jgi:hypothetical protein
MRQYNGGLLFILVRTYDIIIHVLILYTWKINLVCVIIQFEQNQRREKVRTGENHAVIHLLYRAMAKSHGKIEIFK